MGTNAGPAQGKKAPPALHAKKYYWILAEEKLQTNVAAYARFQAIQEEHRHRLQSHAAAPTGGVANPADIMLHNVNMIREKVEATAWKLPFKIHKQEILIRSCLKEVVKALKLFKDVGTAIASLDKIHAGIPWAAFNVVLEASNVLQS
jgi:hypothetical protein